MRIFLVLFSVFLSVQGLGYRLPTTTVPVFYSIKIQPDILNGSFSGEVTIHVDVKDLTDSIVFHSGNLTITEVYLDQKQEDVEFDLEPEFDIIEVYYSNRTLVAPGSHTVHVKYQGSLLDKILGFFRVEAYNEEGEQYYIAATDFQPTYARGAFPCFDEPALKAQFQLTIIAPNSNYTALSNMRIIDKFETSIGVVYKFETSVRMSPYLIAFAIVTGFSSVENTTTIAGKDILFRINARDASVQKNGKSMDFVIKAVDFLTNYTDIPYPLSKIDLIEYRRVRWATENWGLVMTVEGFLTSEYSRFAITEIARILSHELAHFWFGDLVTNNWWDDIWLQEAFATFMGSKVEDYIWNRNKSLGMAAKDIQDLNRIYVYDQDTKDAIPIVRYCEAPLDCYINFDDVTYVKGAQIIRMLEKVMGEEHFQKAIQIFVKKFAFKSATTNDFIEIIETLEPLKDMRGFLESFLYQNRFPYVSVEDNQTTDSFVLTQFSSGFSHNDSVTPLGHKWTIPITYISSTSNDSIDQSTTWFYKEMESLEIPKNGSNWIKLNYRQLGYYRTRYSESLWEEIIKNLEVLDDPEISHLLTEVLTQYKYNLITCEIPLKLLFNPRIYYTFKYTIMNGVRVMVYKFVYNHERETGDILYRYLYENPPIRHKRDAGQYETDFEPQYNETLYSNNTLSFENELPNEIDLKDYSDANDTRRATTSPPIIKGTTDPDLLRCVEWVKVNIKPKLAENPPEGYFFYF